MFSGSWVALVTPMHADGSIDFEAWSRLLEWHVSSGTAGVVVGGTTGESPTLEESELRALVLAARSQLRGRIGLMAGAGTSSTAQTVARTHWLGELGVDALLVVTPAYNKPTQEGLFRHFSAVAAASVVPVVLYNVPGRTAVDMLAPTVIRLAQLPGIVAVKEAVADVGRVGEILAGTPPGFAVLSGDDATAREAVLAGAKGVISVTANCAPRAMADMIARSLAGELERAAALDATLAPLHRHLFVEGNPIPIKWVLQRMGLLGSGIRLPLCELSLRFQPLLLEAMRAANIETKG